MKPEFFALIMILILLALYFTGGSGNQVDDAIREAENEADRLKRLEILRRADQSLGRGHPKLLLSLALATMAVAYEKTGWEEKLELSRQARRASVRAMNIQFQRGWMTPSAKDLLHSLRSVRKAADQCEAEANHYLEKSS